MTTDNIYKSIKYHNEKNNYSLSSIVLCFINAILLDSYKIYEKGPIFNIKSRKKRIAQKWTIIYAHDLNNDKEITSIHFGKTFEFTGNNEYFETNKGINGIKGSWRFSNNNEVLQISLKNNDIEYYRIIRLSENEMWLRRDNEELILTSN